MNMAQSYKMEKWKKKEEKLHKWIAFYVNFLGSIRFIVE